MHSRNHSFSPPGLTPISHNQQPRVLRSNSVRASSPMSTTFAPQFIQRELPGRGEALVQHIEGENDFSGKRYVWLKDAEKAFIKGWVVEEISDGNLLVQCEDGSRQSVREDAVDSVNPAKFDKANDMAELTHLNEASVVHNLHTRYQADLIYTYSGLFLVTVNPYCPLPIYSKDYINMYRGQSREDMKPHIFAVADEAFRNLVDDGENQSILVTGESGAGKTENTKKVIQYLAAVATSESPIARTSSKNLSNLSQQILRANPILESFGNAQTVRNNNSSRFGKFIRIQFSRSGQILGAYIDWYLLEKSRVVRVGAQERNYHIFYQLLRGADASMKRELLLEGKNVEDFQYTRRGNDTISGVSDRDEWNCLIEAFHVMGISAAEQCSIFRTIAAILHLGNITVSKESLRADQAALDKESWSHVRTACKLLGIPEEQFVTALLHPKVKAGREWVDKVQTPEQVRLSIDALAKGIYEREFGDLVEKINQRLNQSATSTDASHYIGVLDIAGFEIFEHNTFEQLCINYTNEKLQQFFNHHMFVLEQEEYAREQIEWKFIDFGRDLQPTIDLIELTNPIGIFSCLDEDSVMPKSTDQSFTEKLNGLWDRKSPKYRPSLLRQGFMVTHYAAEVEYSTEGWLEKNKDPLNDNVTRLLAKSSQEHVRLLFADCADSDDDGLATKNRVKKGLFRTVAQRHKEQLSTLMAQLHSTHPHFVRCILPNHKKRPKLFQANLVLDQLRCNGVLEGIRIARTGFPNRLPFAEFRSRYEVLCSSMPRGYLEGQAATKIILDKLNLDPSLFRVGLTKVFFRAGVLAELEEQRDTLIRDIMSRFQSAARGFTQRRSINKRLYRAEAARIIHQNFSVYLDLQRSPWWNLYVRMKPLLGTSTQTVELKKRDEMIQKLEQKSLSEAQERQKLEEHRRKAELEISKIQQTLEAERALALDKEEIFKRLQDRELELSDKLAGALEDQDSLEGEIDALLLAKKTEEGKVADLQKELGYAGTLMANVEVEKQKLVNEVARLSEALTELEQSKSKTSQAEEQLKQEVRMLSSQLGLKERKIQDLEAKAVKGGQDLDLKLSQVTKELQLSKFTVRDLSENNRTLQAQLTELSTASTAHEDILRMKNSEFAILKTELRKFESDRVYFDQESRNLSQKHDTLQTRLREVQTELETAHLQKSKLEQDIVDAKRMLQDKMTEHANSGEGRKKLESHVEDLKNELCQVKAELSRERQSRDDVLMLGEHKLTTLKRDFESLNTSKIAIEKELYAQQDVLRRTTESRTIAEEERKQHQTELRSLRQRFLELQEDKLAVETQAEKTASRIANERSSALQRDLNDSQLRVEALGSEREQMQVEVQRLRQIISDGDNFKLQHDQHKDRIERELVTVKGRLVASENDNRALLNKIQQKNLDIARSNSRANDSQRTRLSQLQAEKIKQDQDIKSLQGQLDEAKLNITSLEKQKDKLALNLEDLNHEITREHKASRTAEKNSSTLGLQLAEANRKLETERQLRSQAQANTRTVQNSLDAINQEVLECHEQLALLHKVFDPTFEYKPGVTKSSKVDFTKSVNLAKKLEDAEHATRLATERYARAEAQLDVLRARHGEELSEMDVRHSTSKRTLLEEMNAGQVNSRMSPVLYRKDSENVRPRSAFSTPNRHNSNATVDSTRSDRTTDTLAYNSRMDLVSELELVRNQLQVSEMKNRHLQNQIDNSPVKSSYQDESPSVKRAQRLERENTRLHGMLDDSARKVSALENSIRTGHLTLNEVQTKSHEELYDLINSQEQSRRSLLQSHNTTVSDLADAKVAFDDLKQAKAGLDFELRDARSELQELKHEMEQDAASRSQLLQEFAELQVKLDAETSNAVDLASSLGMYKKRADEYYSKLEQAEIAVLKASRAEQFAKSQSKDTEEMCATVMSERKQIDALVDDLQKQVQRHEERVEDMSADLESALQSKKRLQNELEDYRSQRAIDVEDKETSMEQTRRKYQLELTTLNNELEIERENVISIRGDNSRLREELEELRSKWDDEVMNSSTWAKEKSRLEIALEDLSNSRDEAANAHNEAQGKVVSLLQQVRTLRTSLEDLSAEKDALAKEKKTLDSRLKEASDRLGELTKSSDPTTRSIAGHDREVLQLKANLAQQEDIATAAVGKMRRSDALLLEIQKDLTTHRESNDKLHKDKATLEKNVKELQLKLVDLETKGYSSASQDVRYLNGRIQELENQLETLEADRNKDQRSVRNVDRTVRDLEAQLARREKQNSQLNDDISKSRDKIERLLATIDELQTSDSSNQLQSKRAERELREEKEKALRLERELETLKGLRMETESFRRSNTFRALSEKGGFGELRSRREGSIGPIGGAMLDVPQRKSSLSNGKGFL